MSTNSKLWIPMWKIIRIMRRQFLLLLCLINYTVAQLCSDSDRMKGGNLAHGKQTAQSSTWWRYTSQLSVDGNTSTDFNQNSCSHTDLNQRDPAWWSVDLGEERILNKIIIFNRQDQMGRLNNASVIGYSANGSKFVINSSLPGSLKIEIDVKKISNLIRNVTIVLPGKPENILNICEVQVIETIACKVYQLQNGNITVEKTGDNEKNYTYCANLTLKCNRGYQLYPLGIQSPTTRCQSDGNWTTMAHCEVIRCMAPLRRPDNSLLDFKFGIEGNGTYNTTISLKCNEGFLLMGEDRLRCNASGEWDGLFGQCSAIRCTATLEHPDNSLLDYKPGIEGNGTYNTTVALKCNEGYNLIGNHLVRCNDSGEWDGLLGTCSVIKCNASLKQPNDGELIYEGGVGGNGTYNTRVSLRCYEGFELTVIKLIRCDNDGQWKGSLGNCSAIQCNTSLEQPYHGELIYEGGIRGNGTYNTKVTLKCYEGYHTNDNGFVRCDNDGQWKGSLGNCSAITMMESKSSGFDVIGLVGGVAAATCVIIIGIVVAVVFYRRRVKTKKHHNVTSCPVLDDIPRSSENSSNKETDIQEVVISDTHRKNNNGAQREAEGEIKHVYMNSDDKSTDYYSYLPHIVTDKYAIQLDDLSTFFLNRKLNHKLYEEEYSKLPEGLTKPHYKSLSPENRQKNRYKNIYPYDDTRVQLEIWDPATETDYINACYVNGFKTFHAYIGAQGPTKDIINDFWRMIWQTKCSKIVMLTNLTEDGKHKCEKYWPDEGSIEFGDIAVRLMQGETFSDFTIRTLELKKKNRAAGKRKAEPRFVKQFHFTAWPDKGVPRYASSLVHFRHKVRTTKVRGSAEGPIVVHCSAGIGRTGTFLALDYLAEQAEEQSFINVFRCVETLRKQRVNLVQTFEQYVFLHEAVVEALTCPTAALSTFDFHEAMKTLLEPDVKTRKRRLDLEFEKLLMYVVDASEDVYANAKTMDNRPKNRYSNILPDTNHCPHLNVYVKGCGSYINAVFLPAYKENDKFVITQTPLENTKVDFWRMIYQLEISSIVMLNTWSQMKDDERYWPEDDRVLEITPFQITLECKSDDEIATNYQVCLRFLENRRKVLLSRATYWDDGEPVPKSPSSMLKHIDLIQNWQQETGNKPIVAHCMNGAERSGLFCVVAALIERTKLEQDVAVEQIIKQMRCRRPQLIPNVDQFQFCYDVVKIYLEQNDTYSNFTSV